MSGLSKPVQVRGKAGKKSMNTSMPCPAPAADTPAEITPRGTRVAQGAPCVAVARKAGSESRGLVVTVVTETGPSEQLTNEPMAPSCSEKE